MDSQVTIADSRRCIGAAYVLGMDTYVVIGGVPYIHLFGSWCRSSCFKTETDLLDRRPQPHESPEFVLRNFHSF